MKILLLGASGFIGSALARSLVGAGNEVTGLSRDLTYAKRVLPMLDWVHGDLRRMTHPADWAQALAGIEVVINASGALQSGSRDDVDAVQRAAMLALYEAARAVGIRRFIQISAAGIGTEGASTFMASKAAADEALAASGSCFAILRPGLVIGRNCFGGTELLRSAAGLPMLHVDVAGTGPIQCVALSDLVEAVHVVLADRAETSGMYDLVEEETSTLGEIVTRHRVWLGLPPARFCVTMPLWLVRTGSVGADLLGWLGWRSPLRSNAIAALVHGVTGDPAQGPRLLGRPLLSLPEMLDRQGPAGKADRWHARLAGLYPIALAALLLLWLGSGLLGLAKTGDAVRLLVEGGIPSGLARACVIGGSLADLVIAAGLLWRPWLSKALLASLLLAASYCLGALLWRPDLWLDPLGPMLKVLPVLALSALCLAMAEER